ncbi:hypothetical protein B0H66DRAFT_564124 [Apodospora peruviana]|uniref:Secreted protein n=1 Tax=Apodospora peruviana TaxID=516989 RepID=A0AAE0HYR7_9PEZI|nr:hypothetical protein B0H66DRAFT_564124 [Apodospora peruviana]
MQLYLTAYPALTLHLHFWLAGWLLSPSGRRHTYLLSYIVEIGSGQPSSFQRGRRRQALAAPPSYISGTVMHTRLVTSGTNKSGGFGLLPYYQIAGLLRYGTG